MRSPADRYREVEDGECLRARILDEEVGDDGRSDGRVARLADADEGSQHQEDGVELEGGRHRSIWGDIGQHGAESFNQDRAVHQVTSYYFFTAQLFL